MTGLQPAGLPHSDTCGSIHACRSPHIFAACRVLPRRRKPRHPPSALDNFSRVSSQTCVCLVKLFLYLKKDQSLLLLALPRFLSQNFNELSPSERLLNSVFSQTGCKDTDFFITSKFFCDFFAVFFHPILCFPEYCTVFHHFSRFRQNIMFSDTFSIE